jgi:hypothetical protein
MATHTKEIIDRMTYTPGPWTIQYSTNDYEGNLIYANRAIAATVTEEASEATPEDLANARLIAAAPAMLEAIATAGRIVGQVQDNPRMSADERAYALSRACDALGGTYFKTTGKPLEWRQPEPAITKAKEVS